MAAEEPDQAETARHVLRFLKGTTQGPARIITVVSVRTARILITTMIVVAIAIIIVIIARIIAITITTITTMIANIATSVYRLDGLEAASEELHTR